MSGGPVARLRFIRDHFWTGSHASAYLDHELSAEEAARLERHTGACPKCHELLETLRRTLAGLRGMAAGPAAPSGLADSVLERLRSQR